MRRLHERILERIRQLLLLLLLLLLLVEGLRIVVLCLLMIVVPRLLLVETWLWHLGLWLQCFMHPYPLWVPSSKTSTSRSNMDGPL